MESMDKKRVENFFAEAYGDEKVEQPSPGEKVWVWIPEGRPEPWPLRRDAYFSLLTVTAVEKDGDGAAYVTVAPDPTDGLTADIYPADPGDIETGEVWGEFFWTWELPPPDEIPRRPVPRANPRRCPFCGFEELTGREFEGAKCANCETEDRTFAFPAQHYRSPAAAVRAFMSVLADELKIQNPVGDLELARAVRAAFKESAGGAGPTLDIVAQFVGAIRPK